MHVQAAGVRLVLLGVVALAWLAPAVAAHEDVEGLRGRYTVSPEEPLALVRELHFHRMVARVAPLDGDATVTLTIVGPTGQMQSHAGDDARRVNHLVACCDEAAWSPHTVRLTTTAPTEVDVDLAFLHDNVAVVAYDAETGAAWQTALILGIVVAVAVLRSRGVASADAGLAGRARRRGVWFLGAAWSYGLGLVSVGWAGYGGGPFAASLAATRAMPQFGGPILNPHAVVMLGLMVLWSLALWSWAQAERQRGTTGVGKDALGLAILGGNVLVAAIVMLEYQVFVVPLLVAAVPSMLLGYGIFRPIRAQKLSPDVS